MQQQTRLPDELVVCDDRSTDATLAILHDFAASASFPVRIFENEHNLGFVANFEQAIRLCTGELIALSDQDDIWCPTRLERSEQEFAEHPEIGMIFSDADVIDDQDQSTGVRLWQNFGFTRELQQQLLAGDYTVLVKHRFVTGATVVFRSQMRQNILPFGPGWLHDEWIVAAVAGVAEVRPIEEPLIRYRKHASQQVGLTSRPSRREQNKRHWVELSRQIGLLQEICSTLSRQPLTIRGKALLSCYQAHLQFARFRYALPQHRLARVPEMLRHYASYAAYGSGVLSMATDLSLSK